VGATHVTVRITNPAEPDRFWEGLSLVGMRRDSPILRPHLEAIGLAPKGSRTYQLADCSDLVLDITTAEIEFMGEVVGGTIIMGAEDPEPLLGMTALESAGIEVDHLGQRWKRLHAVHLKGVVRIQ